MIEVKGCELLFGRTYKLVITINGVEFKRLWDKKLIFKPVWGDVHGVYNDCEALTNEQEIEIEGAFQAWLQENKITETKLIEQQYDLSHTHEG